ncbi:MAG: HEAT repeat domain-containing protein [Gammaproteobacteria bacterium]|jgi:HEAT repeat protein
MDFVSAYFPGSDPIVNVAVYISIVSAILVFILALSIIILRVRINHRKRRHGKLRKRWNPVLAQVVVGDSITLPTLAYPDTYAFLKEWNDFYGIVRGTSADRLKKLAEKLRIDYYARRMLKSRQLQDKLLGAITLGHMREYSAWDDLLPMVEDAQSVVALTAARSLLLIDPKSAAHAILPTLISNKRWPWSSVAHALTLAGPTNVCTPLAEMAQRASPELQTRLLRYMEVVRCEIITDAVTTILKTTTDDRVLSVCLHIVQDPEALELVRQHLDHPRWHVRMHAANALGKVGNKDDIPHLLQLLEDSEWWVRYRSAQAIASLVSDNTQTLRQLRDQTQDKFGRDMLSHVIAEIDHT